MIPRSKEEEVSIATNANKMILRTKREVQRSNIEAALGDTKRYAGMAAYDESEEAILQGPARRGGAQDKEVFRWPPEYMADIAATGAGTADAGRRRASAGC